jgi:hypothetical protein
VNTLSRLIPSKLHVVCAALATADQPALPRRHTLTHADATGDLYLTIGQDYDRRQISGLYTRLMRDEVLAEWRQDSDGVALQVYCHVSGGLVFGSSEMRDAIFRRELPLVLEAFRYGDGALFEAVPAMVRWPIWGTLWLARGVTMAWSAGGTPADSRIEVIHARG